MTKMISPDISSPSSSSPPWRHSMFKETLDEAVSAIGVNHIYVKHRDSGCLAIMALVIFQGRGSYFIFTNKITAKN